MAKCPRCGSSRIEQEMMPYGPIWCAAWGFRVEDKTATPNPFLDAPDREAAAAARNAASPARSLGASLSELARAARKRPGADPPQDTEGSDHDPTP